MIGLDTNVLVRYITQDDPLQAEQAARLIEGRYREGPADFSDYLLALSNHAAGCETTFSFDTRLCAHPLARPPE